MKYVGPMAVCAALVLVLSTSGQWDSDHYRMHPHELAKSEGYCEDKGGIQYLEPKTLWTSLRVRCQDGQSTNVNNIEDN